MERNYHYYAFISYSTADSKWAKWLQHEISYYHIPSAVKKNKIGIPNKIRPIFIYEYDLAGNQLHSAIQSELEDSKYLIVICSPNAAKSEYVNNEIETFIKSGRSKYIIPFIINGEVCSSDSSQECFPPALLEMMHSDSKGNELRGININTNGPRQALVDLIATMLGIRRDVLWDRYKMRKLKQRFFMSVSLFLMFLLALLYWDYKRPRYEYYADYVDVWGIPTGIIELNKEQLRQRSASYRFEYSRVPIGEPNAYKWRLARVDYVNSAGNPQPITQTAHLDRFPIQKLMYSPENGVLTEITYFNEKCKPQIIHTLSRYADKPASIVDIKNVEAGNGIAFSKTMSGLNTNNGKLTSNITRYVYERNAEGYITKVTYHANNSRDFNSSAVADNFGIWGMRYDLDTLGRRLMVKHLNEDGSYHSNKIGVAARCYEYNSAGNIDAEYTLDLQGNPILNENLWASAVARFDKNGNCVYESYFDSMGNPCLTASGYASISIIYDNRGNQTEMAFYGVYGEPCLSASDIAKMHFKYDNNGYLIESSYYGTDGEPCFASNGVSKILFKYDKQGNVIEEFYYDMSGKPCLNNEGIAKVNAKYDERNNVIEESCYGVDGTPCLNDSGIAKVTAKYDICDNRIEMHYFGVDGEPCLSKGGKSKVFSKYDDRGNLIEEAYFGVDGEPCLNNNGIAKLIKKYDESGNVVEESYYGVGGNLCLGNYAFAKVVSKYDDRGNRIEDAFYGTDGQPCLNDGVFAKVTYKYDDRGNETENAYYGIDGQACLFNNAYAKVVSKFDDRGNRIQDSFYGVDGNLCLNNFGYAIVTCKFDERGNETEIAYYDVNGNPCISYNGYAKGIARFDDRGNRIEVSCYDINGELCLGRNDIAASTMKYDDYGHLVEIANFGVNWEPRLNKEGYAIGTMKYDERGNQIEAASYGVDGTPCLNVYGYAKEITKFDDRGNPIEITFYGIDGEVCCNAIGAAVMTFKHNDNCQVIETSYFDKDRKPVNARGYFKEVRIYDENNCLLETNYYDSEDNILAEQVFTRQISFVEGAALTQGVPVGSVILQFNEWSICDTQAAYLQIEKKNKYAEKEVYYLTPAGEFGRVYVKGGLLGWAVYDFMVEKNSALEWLKQLNEWKENSNDEYPSAF